MPFKPFLTPEFTSEEWQCRTLRTPNNKEWLGVFTSALQEMTNPYNWEQVETSDLTVEDAIAIVEGILTEFYATELCCDPDACLLPDGSRVLRLGVGGYIEQLNNGAWTAPTGEYEIPPTPGREEPTAYERKCLAAANAANVLKLTYEAASDAAIDDLTDAEVVAAMVAVLIATVGAWTGLAVPALVAIAYALLRAFIEIAKFMTIDLWDSEFDALLLCLLYDCATDTADVVTFDLDCFSENYAATVDLTGINALDQLRLFGQIWFMLSVIGADGIDAAGALTAIATADCDVCGGWCYEIDFTLGDGGWVQVAAGTSSPYGTYSSGIGWTTTDAIDTIPAPDVYNRMFYVGQQLASSAVFTHVEIDLDYTKGSFFSNRRAQGIEIGIAYATTIIDINSTPASNGAPLTLTWDGEITSDSVVVFARSSAVTGSPVYSGEAILKRILIRGNGDNPFGEDNCE